MAHFSLSWIDEVRDVLFFLEGIAVNGAGGPGGGL